jgi:hypothetical protein|tara:strand:- start:1523 stop:1684 length:162 start_codon:yes stop_codon:yes gene_type:complete
MKLKVSTLKDIVENFDDLNKPEFTNYCQIIEEYWRQDAEYWTARDGAGEEDYG